MANEDLKQILNKYGDIIKEEVNVKEVSVFVEKINYQKVIKPIGSKLSAKYGKDTGKIIQMWKTWNVEEQNNGTLRVYDNDNNERFLTANEFEISYEWLDEEGMTADKNIIWKLDLNISPELYQEGIAREISRFLNQMRKEADYNVADKVSMQYSSNNAEYKKIVDSFGDFFKTEALLSDIQEVKDPEWDIVSIFNYEEKNINFSLKK